MEQKPPHDEPRYNGGSDQSEWSGPPRAPTKGQNPPEHPERGDAD